MSVRELVLKFERDRWRACGDGVDVAHRELRGLEALDRSAARGRSARSTCELKFDMASLPRWLHQYHGHYCNYTLRVPRRGAAHDAGRDARSRAMQEQSPTTNRRWSSGMLGTEDWWAVWIGLAIFAASLVSLAGADLVGWMARPRAVGMDATSRARSRGASCSRRPARRTRAGIRSRRSPSTYVVFTALFCVGARYLAARRAAVRSRFHGAVRRHLGRRGSPATSCT